MSNFKKALFRYANKTNFIRYFEVKKLFEFLNPQKDEVICDVGCGKEYYDWMLAKRGCKVFGIDADKNAIEKAKYLNNIEGCDFQVGYAENLPYYTSVFDKLISICAIEHFRDDIKALSEMNRVLKPGGTLSLSADSLSNKSITASFKTMHKNRFFVTNYYRIPELTKKLETNGFMIEQIEYILTTEISLFFIKLNYTLPFIFMKPLFFIAYPLSQISEWLAAKTDEGYKILVKARKVGS